MRHPELRDRGYGRSLPSSLPSPYLSGLGSRRLLNASRDRRGPGPARSAKTSAEPRRQRLWRLRGRDRLGGRDRGHGAASRRPAPPAGTRGAQPGAPAPPECLALPPASPAVAPGSRGSAAACFCPAPLPGTGSARRRGQLDRAGPGGQFPGKLPRSRRAARSCRAPSWRPHRGSRGCSDLRDPGGSRPRRRRPPQHPRSGRRRR